MRKFWHGRGHSDEGVVEINRIRIDQERRREVVRDLAFRIFEECSDGCGGEEGMRDRARKAIRAAVIFEEELSREFGV